MAVEDKPKLEIWGLPVVVVETTPEGFCALIPTPTEQEFNEAGRSWEQWVRLNERRIRVFSFEEKL